jgi:hypothetical protein
MRVRFPFFYTADVVMGRTDRIRTETFLESFEVDVPELANADLPVALSYLSYNGTPYVYRHFNGHFLQEVPNPGGVLAKDFIPRYGNLSAHSIARDLIRSIDEPTEAVQQELKKYFVDPDYEAARKPNPSQVREWFIRDRPDGVVVKWMEARRIFEQGDSSGAGWEEAVVQSIEGLVPYIRSVEKRREIELILGVWSESTISLEISDKQKIAP